MSTEPERRGLLGWVVRGLSLAIAAVYAVPALRYVAGRRPAAVEDLRVDLGPLDAIPEGKPVRVPVPSRRMDAWSEARGAQASVFLIRRGTQVAALDSTCPHTGCAVDWDAAAARFRCPCHRSAFAPDGTRLDGPAPRGLDPEEITVEAGRLLLRYRRHRPGRPDRVPS